MSIKDSASALFKANISWRGIGVVCACCAFAQGAFTVFITPAILNRVNEKIHTAIDRHVDSNPTISRQELETHFRSLEARLDRIEDKINGKR